MFPFLRKYFSPFVRQKEELSLLQIFKPLYFLLSVIGLFPSHMNFSNEERGRTVVFKSTVVSLALSLIITVTLCVFFCLHLQELSVASSDNPFTEDNMTLINYIVVMVLMLLVSLIAYISTFRNRNLYINILDEMAGCWADLAHSTSAGILGPLRVKVNCVVLGSLLMMLIVQLVVVFTDIVPEYKTVLIIISFNIPEMIQFTVLAFYFVMLLMTVAILKNIDEHLAIIAHMRMMRGTGNDYVGLKLGSLLKTLTQLRGVYARALTIKRQINAAFQTPVLFILAQGFHSLISDSHTLYHLIAFLDDFVALDIIEECSWIFYQLIKFHILGYSSALLKLQANKIGRTLYDISAYINEDITQYKSSDDANEEITLHLEIQHFATLMKFQDTEITIYGFYPIKTSLLFDVVASAAVYFVILVQFDYGSESVV